jgi:hypothetical protein
MRNLVLSSTVTALALVTVGSVLVGACASQTNTFSGSDGGDASPFGDGSNPDVTGPACASGVYEAKQAPAAMLVLLQRSGSMSQNNKWVFAAQATVQALDQNVFDTMSLGLLAAPSSLVTGPACVFNLPVACGVPAFPQVDLAPAGTFKSTDTQGVRRNIKVQLANMQPDQSAGEGNPLYAAIQSGIGTLKGWPQQGKRILFVVTDGGISCTSLSNRPGFTDGNSCPDWENPNNIITLVKNAQKDPTTPVETFIVGVPGSDTNGPAATYPPYRMRAALSSIAYAGSPGSVPAGCTHTDPFAQNDPDPTTSCHFDMTQNNYSAQAVADAISVARGKVLGCIFELPTGDGGPIDKNKVNVDYSVGGTPKVDLYKRSSSSNDCKTDGCWDYTNDGRVELVGKACDDVKGKPNAKVSITVGCETLVK